MTHTTCCLLVRSAESGSLELHQEKTLLMESIDAASASVVRALMLISTLLTTSARLCLLIASIHQCLLISSGLLMARLVQTDMLDPTSQRSIRARWRTEGPRERLPLINQSSPQRLFSAAHKKLDAAFDNAQCACCLSALESATLL
jgi:hypothetical protein